MRSGRSAGIEEVDSVETAGVGDPRDRAGPNGLGEGPHKGHGSGP